MMVAQRVAWLAIFSTDDLLESSGGHLLEQEVRVGHDPLERVVQLVSHVGRELADHGQALRLHDLPPSELLELLVPRPERGRHGVERAGQLPDLVVRGHRHPGLQVARGHPAGRLDEGAHRGGQAAGEDVGDRDRQPAPRSA